MFHRLAVGWQLAQQSLHVLRLDKELLVFPLLSGIACTLVMASFALPLWMTGVAEEMAQQGPEQLARDALGYVLLFAFYVVNYFVIIFFNTALIACAIIRFKGGNPNLMDGISAASARLPQILGWALVSATIGIILRIIESWDDRVGRFVAGLLGMAWSAVTYFVVPVIVVEKVGPVAAAKRSLAILKNTWGEALSANFSVGLMVFLGSLLAILPIIGGVFAFMSGLQILGIVLIALGIVLIIMVALISSALDAIIMGALYLYASEGTVPEQFDNQIFREAFAHK